MDIVKLWHDGNESDWKEALHRYYENPTVKQNKELEKRMDEVTPETIKKMTVQEFYRFLHEEYFVWKYTAKNRLTTTRKQLEKYEQEGMEKLEVIRHKIFRAFDDDPEDTEELLCKAQQIHGLGIAGASGFLAILFPEYYGTIDQFLVYALWRVENLPEHSVLEKIKPESLSIEDGIILENILRKKAKELNEKFDSAEWNPKKIDMILWALGRK